MEESEKVLQQAAEAAKGLLPKLMEEQQQLQSKLMEINQRIAALQAVITSATATTTLHIGDVAQALVEAKRAPRGQIEDHLDQVLLSGQSLTVLQIMEAIQRRFGVSYGQSSIYSNLSRGVESGKYRNVDGKWSLVKRLI